MDNWNHRVLIAMDNLAGLGALTKGRSGKAPLARICRSFAALTTSYNLVVLIRFVRSESNHADGPSRQKATGYYCQNIDRATFFKALRDS